MTDPSRFWEMWYPSTPEPAPKPKPDRPFKISDLHYRNDDDFAVEPEQVAPAPAAPVRTQVPTAAAPPVPSLAFTGTPIQAQVIAGLQRQVTELGGEVARHRDQLAPKPAPPKPPPVEALRVERNEQGWIDTVVRDGERLKVNRDDRGFITTVDKEGAAP